MKVAVAGTLESNDCLITIKPTTDDRVVEVESIVKKQFGTIINKVINDTLDELGVKNIHLVCNDKGALDYTIKARVTTAVERMQKK